MSWVKKPGGPPAEQPGFAPQQFSNQQNMYPNYAGAAPPQTWPQQQQQFKPAYPPYQQEYPNANQQYQYNQSYPGYNQQGYQQYYPNPQPGQANADAWEDNWDWGWDESTKQAQLAAQNAQTQPFNNANVIEESFASTDTWNWAMEEKKAEQPDNSKTDSPKTEEVKLSDKDAVKERVPNLALGKRFNTDSLTPQWSIESQMSQESSDAHTHSESTYRSDNQSRNSTKSSPGVNAETNFSFPAQDMLPPIDWPTPTPEEIQHIERDSSHELASSLQEMSIVNKEPVDREIRGMQETSPSKSAGPIAAMTPAHSVASMPPAHSVASMPPTHPVAAMPPASVAAMPPAHSVASMPPVHSVASMPPASVAAMPPAHSVASMPPVHSVASMPPASVAAMPPAHPVASMPPAHSVASMPPASVAAMPPAHPVASMPPASVAAMPPAHPVASMPPASVAAMPPAHPVASMPPASVAAMPPAHPVASMPPASVAAMPPASVAAMPPAHPVASMPPASVAAMPPASVAAMPPAHPVASMPPASVAAMPPAPPVTGSATLPPTSLPPPPTNFPTSNQNPFKNTGSFSHKSTPSKSSTPSQPFPTMSSLTSPAAVNKVQHRPPVGFGANLETTPDNSERPDQPQVPFRPIPVTQQVPDNLEVAPQNDRNEYLQTAHLSTGDYGENTDFSRSMPPPPGLRRMVVGQQESEYGQTSADEPPPGLARMVPGQQTETDNAYSQPGDNYMDRHIDGQPTDDNPRPYRQADGQQTSDYSQPQANRSSERRPIGLDRMVPGEPSNDEYPQYQAGYNANEQRVVTGLDHDYQAGPTDIREQNVDGSDYTESTPRNPFGNVRGSSNDVSVEFNGPPEEQQREVMMEGENLEDLSVIAPVDMTFARELVDGADTTQTDAGVDRKTDLSESDQPVSSSRRQSNRGTSGEESERDRYKSSPRRDRDKHKSSRDKDRDKERYGRDSRGKYEREPGRSGRREREDKSRREREESPESRKARRARSHRYETEDTDYYSDRERDRRRYREGSYGKPPRPDDYRRHDDRRRYATTERDRRYDDDDRRRYGRYRDIDPTRKYGNLRRDEERRGDPYSPSRTESRDAGPTDDELNETHASTDSRRRDRDRHRRRRRTDGYYDGYASVYADPYALQRQQYQYYEHLRLTNPARYMEIYKQIMAGQPPPPPPPEYLAAATKITAMDGYGPLGYEGREDRGSVHSGRSSANGLKGTDTELNTDASLNLHLEESTVRSERMTPFKFSTAHIKGNISSRHLVVVRPSYPVDGLPATVQILSLSGCLAGDPATLELATFPGPLVKGVTHKKSVIEYCASRVRNANGRNDVIGYVLVWELLALLLRQNGVVVGTDIAELLMKNKRDFEFNAGNKQNDGRGSSVSEEEAPSHASDLTPPEESNFPQQSGIDEKTAVDQLREYLTYGNRQEAIEWAMSHNLWGHAFQLAAHGDRRARAAVASRFLSQVPRADPLHTLYHALHGRQPPAATCVADERWGDWRAHAAIILSNPSSKPDNETRTLTQMGDSLSSRGLLYSAQFCYVSAQVPFSRHPLAPFAAPPTAPTPPPRLTLLLADSRADSLSELATNEAIFATEIYEYALSLSQDYSLGELQAYKFLVACRLVDAGEYERALAYTEALARAVTRAPRDHPPALVAQLVQLADRLKYHDPALQEDAAPEEGDSGDPSPRHQQWLGDVADVAHVLAAEAEASKQATPVHQPPAVDFYPPTQYGWSEPAQPELYNTQPAQSAYPEPYPPEEPYYPQQQFDPEWRKEQYPEPYWPQETYQYEAPAEAGAGAGAEAAEEQEEQRPTITMPGAAASRPALYTDYEEDRPPSADADRDDETRPAKKAEKPKQEQKKSGWLGGIFNKLSLRSPNQMILPDDKNPTIVWDKVNKRWQNLDADEEDSARAPPPPPKTQDIPAMHTSSPLAPPTTGLPPTAPVSNIFKMQKGRHIKKSYVDVFNPGGAARPLPPAAEVLGPAPQYMMPAQTYDPTQADDNSYSGI